MRRSGELDTRIGQRLRRARLAVDLTQDDLAKKIGLSFQQIQKYENGTNRVAAARIPPLAQALNVPIMYFYDAAEPDATVDATLPDNVLRVARVFNELEDGDVRSKLFALVKAVGKS